MYSEQKAIEKELFFNNIKLKMAEKGLNNEELASYLGVSRQAVSDMLILKRGPKIERLLELADFLDTSLISLFGGEGDTQTLSKEEIVAHFNQIVKEELERLIRAKGGMGVLTEIGYSRDYYNAKHGKLGLNVNSLIKAKVHLGLSYDALLISSKD